MAEVKDTTPLSPTISSLRDARIAITPAPGALRRVGTVSRIRTASVDGDTRLKAPELLQKWSKPAFTCVETTIGQLQTTTRLLEERFKTFPDEAKHLKPLIHDLSKKKIGRLVSKLSAFKSNAKMNNQEQWWLDLSNAREGVTGTIRQARAVLRLGQRVLRNADHLIETSRKVGELQKRRDKLLDLQKDPYLGNAVEASALGNANAAYRDLKQQVERILTESPVKENVLQPWEEHESAITQALQDDEDKARDAEFNQDIAVPFEALDAQISAADALLPDLKSLHHFQTMDANMIEESPDVGAALSARANVAQLAFDIGLHLSQSSRVFEENEAKKYTEDGKKLLQRAEQVRTDIERAQRTHRPKVTMSTMPVECTMALQGIVEQIGRLDQALDWKSGPDDALEGLEHVNQRIRTHLAKWAPTVNTLKTQLQELGIEINQKRNMDVDNLRARVDVKVAAAQRFYLQARAYAQNEYLTVAL